MVVTNLQIEAFGIYYYFFFQMQTVLFSRRDSEPAALPPQLSPVFLLWQIVIKMFSV